MVRPVFCEVWIGFKNFFGLVRDQTIVLKRIFKKKGMVN